ncbi:MAG: hypothetical protein F6J97_22460 [Leptolyngbya sp. SIO4C1]|nr:hypothetical protein [Leptolyngbya sp. SIO4C1]
MVTSKFKTLKTAAIVLYHDLGEWTYDTYADINRKYFGNAIALGGVQWGLTPYGSSIGFYNPKFDTITLHQSLALRERLAYDVLLHEMIHQYLHQTKRYGADDDAHHSQVWCDQLNRIGQLLELPYYYTLWRKTTERLPIDDPIIKGRYCDIETRRVRRPPTKAQSTWVPVDEQAKSIAESKELSLANHSQLLHFPQNSRPKGYYNDHEVRLLQENLSNSNAD